jgi:putative transposase
MSRRQRLHVPGGTYYIVQHGSTLHPIFSQPEDYGLLERLLSATLNRTGARLHAYCWTPSAIHLVLQIADVSVGRIMQGLTSRYARSMHQRFGESGHFFRQRYQAALIDPDAYLLKLVHYIHHRPVLDGLVEQAGAHPYSSHNAYLGEVHVPWLHTRTTLHALNGCDDTIDQVELMTRRPVRQDVELFERCGSNHLRVIGTPEFLANLPRPARPYRSKISLDQIVETVTRALGVSRDHVMSSSRARELALARALIAWYAAERHVATLSQVARYLRRDPSTLSVAISRYRVCRPELFKLNSLHYMVPLGPVSYRPVESVAVEERSHAMG